MADSNISITPGSGTEVDTRTESTNGHHRQVIVIGDPSTNAGLAPVDATAGIKVNLGADNDVTVTGTIDLGATDNAVLDAIAASVAAIDTDTTTIIGHVDGLEALIGTTNTTLTTIDGRVDGIETLLTAIDGRVDGVEALLTTIDADTSNLSVLGGGTEAAAIRVTIANNSTGVLSIDDNGSSITIDGTVTAELSATDNAVLDDIASDTESIKTAVEILDNAISGNEMQVDVLTMPTVTVSPSGFATIGHGVKTVTSAGTDEALAGSTACKRVTIQAQTDNTGVIAVGDAGVDATVATGTGVLLFPGDIFEFDITNLASVFIDATVSTDGVRYTYFV